MSDGDFSDSADYSGHHPDDLSPGVGGEDDDDGVYHDHDHDQEGSQTLDDENEYTPDQDIHTQQHEDGQRRRSHHLHEMHADDDSLDHSNSHSHQQSSQDLLAQQLSQTELGHSHSHMDDLQHDPTLQEQIHHAEPIEISAPQGASHEVNEAAQKLNHILHRTEDGEEHTHTSHDHHRQSSTRRSSGLHGATAPSSNADYLRDMEVPPQATSSFSPSNKRASATGTKRESLQDSLRDRTHSASRRRRQSNQHAEEEKEEFAHHHHQDDDLQQELEDAPDDDYFDDLGDEEEEEEEVRTYEDVQRAKEEREHLIEVNRLRVRQIASILEREKLLKNSANKDGSNNNNSNNNNSSSNNNNNNNNNDMNTTPEQTRLEYVKTLEQLNSIWDELERKREDAEQRIDRLTIKLDKADAACLELSDSFKQFKREIARESRFSRNGQSIKLKRILAFEANEENLDRIVAKVRLRYIYLLKELNKLEESVMKKEKLAEGLHLIDFEQLKIENQTLNEKIEERNDELHKLRKKTTTTVQVLTHIKEKLWFVSEENTYYANELQQLIAKVGGLRDELTRNKIKRDQLRMDNGVLKQKQGFIGSDLLVNDFEMRKHDLGTMAGRVDELKARWRALDDLVQKATQMEKFQAKVMQQQLRGNQPFATLKFNQRR